MNLPLYCIKGIFVSNMHHWGMGKEETKRVWKESEKALQKTERKLRGHRMQRQARSWQADRRFWSLAHHCPAAAAPAAAISFLPCWAEGSPGTAFPSALLLLLPTQGTARGDTCTCREMCQGLRLAPSLGVRQPISGSGNLGRFLFQNACNTSF